jgi:hypothetical protein
VHSKFNLNNAKLIAGCLLQALCLGDHVVHISPDPKRAKNIRQELKNFGFKGLLYTYAQATSGKSLAHPQIELAELDVDNSPALTKTRDDIQLMLDAVHKDIAPWKVSYGELVEKLLGQKRDYGLKTQFSYDTCINIAGNFAKYSDLMRDFVEFEEEREKGADGFKSHGNHTDTSIWERTNITTDEQIEDITKRLEQVQDISLPSTLQYIKEITDFSKILVPENLEEWNDIADVLQNIRQIQDVFINDVFDRDIVPLIEATAPKERADSGAMGFFERNRLAKEAKELIRPGQQVNDIYSELVRIHNYKMRWNELQTDTSDLPEVIASKCVVNLASSVLRALNVTATLMYDITAIEHYFADDETYSNLREMSFDELQQFLNTLLSTKDAVALIPKRRALLEDLEFHGLADFAREFAEKNLDEDALSDVIENTYYRSIRQFIEESDDIYQNLSANDFEQLRAQWCELDIAHIRQLVLPAQMAYNQNTNWKVVSLDPDELTDYITHYGKPDTLIFEDSEDLRLGYLGALREKGGRSIFFGDTRLSNELRLVDIPAFRTKTRLGTVDNLDEFLSDYIVNKTGKLGVLCFSEERVRDVKQGFAKRLQKPSKAGGGDSTYLLDKAKLFESTPGNLIDIDEILSAWTTLDELIVDVQDVLDADDVDFLDFATTAAPQLRFFGEDSPTARALAAKQIENLPHPFNFKFIYSPILRNIASALSEKGFSVSEELIVTREGSDKSVALYLDDKSFYLEGSNRLRLRHYEQQLRELGHIPHFVFTAAVAQNFNLEVAKISDLFTDEQLKLSATQRAAEAAAKAKQEGIVLEDKDPARTKQFLENKPPHWG